MASRPKTTSYWSVFQQGAHVHLRMYRHTSYLSALVVIVRGLTQALFAKAPAIREAILYNLGKQRGRPTSPDLAFRTGT